MAFQKLWSSFFWQHTHTLRVLHRWVLGAGNVIAAAITAAITAKPEHTTWGMRREDGRALHPCYLFEAKAPSASRQEWDVAKVLATTSMDEAFRPLSEGGCPMVKA